MKFGKKLLLASAMVMTHSANASVEVSFAPDVETVIVNGNKTLNLLEKTDDLTLNNGLNQIVVRVSKLIQGQGEIEKYRSEPVVITFTANNQTFHIKPDGRIINFVDAKNFNDNPSMEIVTDSGSIFDAKVDVLPRNNLGDSSVIIGRDYLKDLAYYNQSQGYGFAGEKPLVEPKKKPKQLVKLKSTTTAVEPIAVVQSAKIVAAEQELKKIYLQLTPEQRKAFLGWAVTQ
ncbi:YccT family protein [Photobacterium leiognathi]|uniref:YccT family protein n=1 Tax=Photobacterium leiognathi TaxID=553611 RepID=UPI002981AB43|nr:DUF2057 domain-containing protein [Photobacterium leiognathi]